MSAPPDIRTFSDHRAFLRVWFAHQRKTDPGFSQAALARKAGLSRSALSNILSGTRLPRTATVEALAGAMGLSPTDRNLLGMLVELEKAGSVAKRSAVTERMLRQARYEKVRFVEDEPSQVADRYFASWYVPAVRELAAHPGFRADPAWVARTLVPSITAEQAQEALDTLVDIGCIEVGDDGRVVMHEVRVMTRIDVESPAVTRYHAHVVPELLRNLADIPHEQRHLMAAVILLPASLVPEVKLRIAQLIQNVAALSDVAADPSPRAYHLGVQLVPVSNELGLDVPGEPGS